ncbi:MAG: outer membrane protein assembly factor BamB [Magnetococcales bacterium]|nr:outer membrane protein assembly factor BamB [Magnetococcales bacterium]
MNHWVYKAAVFAVALLLSGCSSWSNPFKEPVKGGSVEGIPAYVEPQTKASTGLNRVWKTSVAGSPDKHQQQPGQIVVAENDLYIATFQGRLVRLNRENGRVVWEVTVAEHLSGGVALEGERLFVGSLDGEMVALSRDTGKELWRSELSAPVTSAPVVARGKVIFATLDSRTYALSSEDGRRLWVHSTPPEILVVMGAATPTVDGSAVYVGYPSGDVFALALESGSPVWSENLSVTGGRSELDLLQDVVASVVVSREADSLLSGVKKIFAVNHQGRAVAMLPNNGSRVWEHKLSAIRRPWLMGKQLLFSEMEGYVVALSAGEGLESWRTRVSDGLLSAAVSMGSKVVVADNRGRLVTLDAGTGQVLGMDRLGDAVLADPVVVDNSLFLWTNEGNVYRYDF